VSKPIFHNCLDAPTDIAQAAERRSQSAERDLAADRATAWFDLSADNLAALSENSMSAEERIADLVQQVRSLRLSGDALIALVESNKAEVAEIRRLYLLCEGNAMALLLRAMEAESERDAFAKGQDALRKRLKEIGGEYERLIENGDTEYETDMAKSIAERDALRTELHELKVRAEILTKDRDALHFEVHSTASALGCELHQVADCARDMMRDIENYAESGAVLTNEVSALASCVREACDAWVDGLSVRHGDDWAEKFPNIKRRIDELLNIALGPNPYEPSA